MVLNPTSIIYNGEERTVDVIITIDGTKLTKSDYKTTFSNNIEVGKANVLVEGLGNYSGRVSLTFDISEKDYQVLTFEKSTITKTYEDSDFSVIANHTTGDGVVSYTSSNPAVATVDNSGKVSIKKAGTTTITASATETEVYQPATASYTLTVNKKDSVAPEEVNREQISVEGKKLSDITFETTGLVWNNEEEIIKKGSNSYKATYTKNNDSTNYNSVEVEINIYGKSLIDVNTSVTNSENGTISSSKQNVEEGKEIVITFTPNEGYEIGKVKVNGKEQNVSNNKLTLTAKTEDLNVEVTYKKKEFSITITKTTGVEVEIDSNKVPYDGNKTITIKAIKGYHLTSVKVNNEEKINDLNENKLTLTNIKKDHSIKITAEKIIYNVIAGASQEYEIGTDNKAEFEIDADIQLFDYQVFVDDIFVNENYYTTKEGSTIVTFAKEFLDKLEVGTHTLRVEFSDGGEANTTFTIKTKQVPVYEAIPNTMFNVESKNILLYILLSVCFIISGICLRKFVKERK